MPQCYADRQKRLKAEPVGRSVAESDRRERADKARKRRADKRSPPGRSVRDDRREEPGIDRADFDPTLATLREGVVNVAIDRALEEVDGWEKKLRAADDRELTPVADNLAALRIELEREPLDGFTVSRLLQTLASQAAHLSGEGTEAESAAPVAAQLEELAKLLYNEGKSLQQP